MVKVVWSKALRWTMNIYINKYQIYKYIYDYIYIYTHIYWRVLEKVLPFASKLLGPFVLLL